MLCPSEKSTLTKHNLEKHFLVGGEEGLVAKRDARSDAADREHNGITERAERAATDYARS